jgi:Poly(ADP-ribose) polymerase catalytic domain
LESNHLDPLGEAQARAQQRAERRWLWHGTNVEVMEKIMQQGFNRSFCGKNATMYGKGKSPQIHKSIIRFRGHSFSISFEIPRWIAKVSISPAMPHTLHAVHTPFPTSTDTNTSWVVEL